MEVEIGRGKKARRAYGFDDIAIVPSRRTRDPDDVDISLDARAVPVRAAAAGRRARRRRLARDGRDHRQARRAGRAQPRGDLLPLRGRRRAARADRHLLARHRHAGDAGHLPRAGQARADRAADQGDQGPGRRRGRLAHAPEGAQVLRGRARGRARHPRHPGHGRLRRARLAATRRRPPLNLKEFIRELAPTPVVVGGCASYHTGLHLMRTGAAGVLVGVGPGRDLHDPRRARDRRPAGDGDRRRRRRALAAHARDGRLRQGDRRRRDAQRRRHRQGDRLRRRRGDARLGARSRLRGARSRLQLGHGDLPPDAAARHPRRDHAERHARGDHQGPRA